jgi:hypothetical protein
MERALRPWLTLSWAVIKEAPSLMVTELSWEVKTVSRATSTLIDQLPPAAAISPRRLGRPYRTALRPTSRPLAP